MTARKEFRVCDERENNRARYKALTRAADGETRCDDHRSLLFRMQLMTRSEVAKVLGITRQAVHQTERAALNKIRKAMRPFYDDLKGI